MAWSLPDALHSLRANIGDTATDKFVFRQDCLPIPDGVATQFHTGDRRLVPGSLKVYVNGAEITQTDEDYEAGHFTVQTPPTVNRPVQASYYYQWLTDEELEDFLVQALGILGFEDPDDEAFPVGLRAAALAWATGKAFTFKAAEYADSMSGSAPGGYTLDKKEASPNWARLAQQQFEMGEKMLKVYLENPLAVKTPVLMFSTAFRLPTIVPRS